MNTNGKKKMWKEYHRKLHTYNSKWIAYEKLVREYCYSFENGGNELDIPIPPTDERPTPPINN